MPVIRCPICDGKVELAAETASDVVCRHCGQSFRVQAQGPAGQPTPGMTTSQSNARPKPAAEKEFDLLPLDDHPRPSAAPTVSDTSLPGDGRTSRSFGEPISEPPPSGRRNRDEPSGRKRRDEDDGTRRELREPERDEVEDRPRSRRHEEARDKGPQSRRRDDDQPDRPRLRQRDQDEEAPRSRRYDADRDGGPRSRRRREEDDEDAVRSKRDRSDDEEDDDADDDSDRRRRRSRWVDDEPPRSQRRPPIEESTAQYRNARIGATLIGIGLWCQVGAMVILLVTMTLEVLAHLHLRDLYLPAGLLGASNWLLGLIGFCFLLAGSRRGSLLGLTIALAIVAAAHVFTILYFIYNRQFGLIGPRPSIQLGESIPTQLLNVAILVLFALYKTAPVLAGALELIRFTLFALVIKQYGRIGKDSDVSRLATTVMILMPATFAVGAALFLILRIILKNSEEGIGKHLNYVLLFITALVLVGFTFVYGAAALLCGKAKEIMYRPRS